jgi:hypothetical protein
MRRVRTWLIALLAMDIVLACGRARAEGPTCSPDDAACACAADDACWAWEYVYSGRSSLLGVRGTLSAAATHGDDRPDAGFMAAYATDRYVTLNEVTGRVTASGAIGAGTAGTEGSLHAAVAFGWRAASTPTRGLFVRGGASGLLLGHERLALSLFEPALLEAGFQILEPALLVECGLSTGFVALGRYEPPHGDGDNLARSGEVGSFLVVQVSVLRLRTSLQYLPARLTPDGISLALAHAAACARIGDVALCGDLLYANATSQSRRGSSERSNAVYSGLTVGLSP